MEQSDTPRTDLASAEGYFDGSLKWVPTGNSDQVVTALARDLERELAAVTRERDKARAEVGRLRGVLQRLACLGNGDRPGNSEGNVIALEALAATEAP